MADIRQMLKATKIRIYPTPEQAEFLNRQFGAGVTRLPLSSDHPQGCY